MKSKYRKNRASRVLLSPDAHYVNLLVLVRILTGILMLKHCCIIFDADAMTGTVQFFAKINIPMPEITAYVSKSAEFLGGILLILGLFTRPVCLILIFNMLVALGTAFGFDIFKGETAALFLLIFVVHAVIGGGKYSLDYLITNKKR